MIKQVVKQEFIRVSLNGMYITITGLFFGRMIVQDSKDNKFIDVIVQAINPDLVAILEIFQELFAVDPKYICVMASFVHP